MRAIDYWSKLSGYWRLFKDKDAFTIVWDAMLAGVKEYSKLKDDVTHPGVLRCPDTISLSWEKIIANDGEPIASDRSAGYSVVSVPAMRSLLTGVDYYLGDDYTIADGVISWGQDPGEDYYLAHEIIIKSDMLDDYYNSGLFNIDLSAYGDDQRKWIMYACMRYLEKGYSIGHLNNIIAILSGVPFTKYFGQITEDNGQFRVAYDIVVESDYEEYLKTNMLEGYCFIDEDAGNVYDINYPDDGLSLTLCHKSNMHIDDSGKPKIVIRGENIGYTGDINSINLGELIPIVEVSFINDRTYSEQYDPTPIPVVGVNASSNGTVLNVPVTYANLVPDGSRMKLDYLDNIVIYECIASDENTLVVDDPMSHIFEVGEAVAYGDIELAEDMVIVEDSWCPQLVKVLKLVDKGFKGTNIMSGIYNREESKYYLKTVNTLIPGSTYSVMVIRQQQGVYGVSTSVNGDILEVIVPIILKNGNMPITMMQCDETVRTYRETLLLANTVKGLDEIMLDSAYEVESGDVISISDNGNQDYYVVVSNDGATPHSSVGVTPSTVRDYRANAAVYNNKNIPTLNTVDVTMPENETMQENIRKYFKIWSMGHTLSETNENKLNVSEALNIDDRFWVHLGGGTMKEIE